MPRRERFNVEQLIAKLQKCDPKAIPVMSSVDHSYRRVCGAYETDAELYDEDLYEYYDDANMNEGAEKIAVVLIQ